MENQDLFFKIIGAVGILFGIGFSIFKTWQHNAKKIVSLTMKQEQHEKELEEMKQDFKERFDKLENKIIGNSDANRLEHSQIVQELAKVSGGVEFIKGYISKEQPTA